MEWLKGLLGLTDENTNSDVFLPESDCTAAWEALTVKECDRMIGCYYGRKSAYATDLLVAFAMVSVLSETKTVAHLWWIPIRHPIIPLFSWNVDGDTVVHMETSRGDFYVLSNVLFRSCMERILLAYEHQQAPLVHDRTAVPWSTTFDNVRLSPQEEDDD